MRVLDYGWSCQDLLAWEAGRFEEWISCVVQDGSNVLDIFILTRDYVITQFSISEVWVLRAGRQRLPKSGWEVLLRDLPFLQEDRLQRNCYRKILKLFFARALGIYGHDYVRYWSLPHNALAS